MYFFKIKYDIDRRVILDLFAFIYMWNINDHKWHSFRPSSHSVQSDLNVQLLHLRPCWKTPSPTKSGSISSCTLRRSGRRRNSFSRPSRWEQMWRWALKATVDLVGPSVFLFKKCGLDLQLMCCWLFFCFGRPLFYCNIHRASAEKQLILLTAAIFFGEAQAGGWTQQKF